jgi:multidrug resistance efflux pump
MVGKGVDAKEDLETAQTTYKSAVADHDALVAQQQAVGDSVKVAQAQLNVANSLLNANQAQVKEYTAALQSAQIDLDHTNIKAPVDGVVVSRNVDVGQTVVAPDSWSGHAFSPDRLAASHSCWSNVTSTISSPTDSCQVSADASWTAS